MSRLHAGSTMSQPPIPRSAEASFEASLREKSPEFAPLSWFARSFAGYGSHLAELLTLSIVLRLLALVGPFAMQAIIDRILPFQRSESLTIILVLLLAVALFQAVIGYSAGLLGLWMSTRIGRDLSLRAIAHVFHLPFGTVQRWPVGELVSRIGEIGKIQAFLGYATSGLLLDAGFALVYAAVLFLICPLLTLVLLLAMPLQLALYLIFGPLERRRYDRAFMAGAAYNAKLVDALAKRAFLPSDASLRGSAARPMDERRRALDHRHGGARKALRGRP
jgi:ATP-binding cassette, subfamily B, bacterial HlyB/CyaB